MEITRTFYARNRKAWRQWLEKNHATRKEVWLVYYNKASGKPRIPYNDAVEEALCFGWIDSTAKKVDHERFAQRFTPRKPGSPWSEMNKVRFKRLQDEGKVMPAGMEAAATILREVRKRKKFKVPPDIEKELKKDKAVWENFCAFPESYRQIRIGFINNSRNRPEFFKQRLAYFIKMTAQNKQFGMVR